MNLSDTFQVTLPSDTEILVKREFDAPREAVFSAHTKPELLERWMTGPPGWSLTRCDLDLRAGGSAHYEWKGVDGSGFGLRQTIHEFVPPSRMVTTERFEMGEGAPMGVQYVTLEFADAGERTHMTMTLRYDDKASRDGALASGMDKGMAASYDKLDLALTGARA